MALKKLFGSEEKNKVPHSSPFLCEGKAISPSFHRQ